MSLTPSRPRAPYEQDDSALSPQFVLDAARRLWLRATVLGLLTAALCAGIGYALWQPRWEATAYLKVDPTFIFKSEHFDILAFSRSQLELFKSPAVLESALQKPAIAERLAKLEVADPIAWVRKRLTTSVMGESQVFVVTMTCEHRDLPNLVVNAIVDSYMTFTTSEAEERQRMRLQAMNARLSALRKSVKEQTDRWASLAKKAGHMPIPGAVDPNAQKLATLTGQLTFVTSELTRSRSQLEAKRRQAGGRRATSDRSVETVRTELSKCDAEIAALERELTSLPPTARLRREPLEAKHAERSRARTGLQQDLTAATAAAELENLQSAVDQHEHQHRTLMEQISSEAKRMEGNRDLVVEMDAINRKLQSEQTLELQVANERAKEEMEGAVKRVHRMKDAEPPKSRMEDGGPLRRGLLFGVAGFLLPAALLFVREWFVRPIGTPDDLSRATLLAQVGEVSSAPRLENGRGGQRDVVVRAENARYQDSVDYLRVSLLANRAADEVRSLAVMSAEEGEGKTTLAYNLACSLSESTNGRVLLLDADLRRPALHARLRLPSSPGAADCLVGRAFPEDAVLPTAFDNLDFLPAGSNLGNPTTLFSENRFAQMLERLRERYEFVIVDTPPVLAFGEAIVAALAVDGAVLCALRDRSHATAVAKARARLQAAGVRLLTAVLNNAPSSHSTNSYYYRRAAENGLPAVRAGQRA